jgi:hypothetical protein
MKRIVLAGCAAAIFVLASPPVAGAQGNSGSRVGVYDSRAVSYAYFWSPPVKRDREALIKRARAAEKAGDTAQMKELGAKLGAMQRQSMLEVFSKAPADEAIASLADQLPSILDELGVVRLVSKWDEKALSDVPESNRVDVTDRIVRAFFPMPSDHLRDTIRGIEAAKPVPLWEAKVMCLFGSLVTNNDY